MTGPQLVYVLLIISPGQVSRPAVFGSLESAKDTAGIMATDTAGTGSPGLSWDDDEDGSEASPGGGVRFVITMELVRP